MERPAPLVPAEVDLTDFKFMPLEVSRLLDSEWWTIACMTDPRLPMAAVNLWAKAWHQRPAASVPDNDAVLATWARISISDLREVKAELMRPWVLCDDGRWYHPVVAEKAVEAWQTKCSYAKRESEFSLRQSQRAKKRWQKPDDATADATADAGRIATADAMADAGRNANESKRNSNSKRKIEDQSAKALFSTADAMEPSDGDISGPQPARQPTEGYTAEFEAWWKVYPRKDGKGAAFKAFRRAKARAPVEKLLAGAAAYAKRRRGEDPAYTKQAATWLNADCWNDEPDAAPKRRYPPGFVPLGVGG